MTYAPMVKTGVDVFCQGFDWSRNPAYGSSWQVSVDLSDGFCVDFSLAYGREIQLFFRKCSENKHFHAFFTFSDGSTLVYQDVRKFGTMELLGKADVEAYFLNRNLGPEPTEEDF